MHHAQYLASVELARRHGSRRLTCILIGGMVMLGPPQIGSGAPPISFAMWLDLLAIVTGALSCSHGGMATH